MVFVKGKIVQAAAAAVGMAGIVHLYLAVTLLRTSFIQFGEFFLIVGAAQLFWIIPTLKLGRPWLYGGIGGNLALFALWLVTRIPNPVTRIGLPINTIGITEETLQLAYVGLSLSLLYVLHKGTRSKKREEMPKA